MMQNTVRRAVVPLVLLATLGLAGCSGTLEDDGPSLASNSPVPLAVDGASEDSAELGSRMIGKPYKAGGRWFTPAEDPDYDETGKASWYGAELHGRRTANGERFHADRLTAAHPTLPLPSYVRVTNVGTGTSAVVRVNDRGPFHRGRIIDVSRAAAEKLEFRRSGSAKVRVEYLGPAELDGGDDETLIAEAKYGVTPGTSSPDAGHGRSFRDMIPFGRRHKEPEGGPVQVRLASVSSNDVRVRGAGDALPGVILPEYQLAAVAPTPAENTDAQRQAGAMAADGAEPQVDMASLSDAERAQAYADKDVLTLDDIVTSGGDGIAPVEMSAPTKAVTAVAAPSYDAPEPDAAPLRQAAADEPAVKSAPAALAVAPAEVTTSRFEGAYDLFAAIDTNSGGSGELHGTGTGN